MSPPLVGTRLLCSGTNEKFPRRSNSRMASVSSRIASRITPSPGVWPSFDFAIDAATTLVDQRKRSTTGPVASAGSSVSFFCFGKGEDGEGEEVPEQAPAGEHPHAAQAAEVG